MRVLSILLCLIPLCSCSQKLDSDLLKRRKEVLKILQDHLSEETANTDFIAFASGDDYEYIIVLAKGSKRINEYYFKNQELVLSGSRFNGNESLRDQIFKRENYFNGTITFSSDYYSSGYELAQGNTTYFVYITSDRTRLCEARLSMIVKPNPINAKIYNYLVARLLDFSAGRIN